MLKTLTEKVGNSQEYTSNVSTGKLLRKNQQEMLEVKNTEIEINTFDGLINRMETVEERIGESKDRSIGTARSKMQREKILDEKRQNPRAMGKLPKL